MERIRSRKFSASRSGSGPADPFSPGPPGWSARGQTLFWAYATLAVLFVALTTSRVIYGFIEKLMWVVAVVTVAGLAVACSHPRVLASLPSFLGGIVWLAVARDPEWAGWASRPRPRAARTSWSAT